MASENLRLSGQRKCHLTARDGIRSLRFERLVEVFVAQSFPQTLCLDESDGCSLLARGVEGIVGFLEMGDSATVSNRVF